MTDDKWAALAAPFPEDEISLLPRYTGAKENKGKDKRFCKECGTKHDFPAIHLSYVGHADITTRLNEVDPDWTWEPMGFTADGLPALDANGGLWAWMTVLGVRKPAYGDPGLNYKNESKKGTTDGMKEAIGDMIRNGAMRFGVGTYLWSKSDRAKALLAEGIDPDPEPAPAAVNPLKADWEKVKKAYKGHTDRRASVLEYLGKPASEDEALAAFCALGEAERVAVWTLANGGEVS